MFLNAFLTLLCYSYLCRCSNFLRLVFFFPWWGLCLFLDHPSPTYAIEECCTNTRQSQNYFRKNEKLCHRSIVHLFTNYLFKTSNLSYTYELILFAIKITTWAVDMAQLLKVFLHFCSHPETKEHKRTLVETGFGALCSQKYKITESTGSIMRLL